MEKKIKIEDIINKLSTIEVLINQGKTTKIAVRDVGISDHTYYKWRKEFGSMEVSQAKELKRLRLENSQLKKAVGELILEKLILKEALSGKFHGSIRIAV